MGRARDRIRQGAARLFEKSRRHQQSILKRSGFIVLCAILVAILVLWFHRDDPRAINYAADLIPGVLSILIAFVPDLRKQHMAWRIAIVVVGILGSVLLWKKETLADAAQRAALKTAIEQANKHADERIAEVRTDVKGVRDDVKDVSRHSDESISVVRNDLKDISQVMSKGAAELNKNIDKVKPTPPQSARLQFSFLVSDTALFPLTSKVVPRNTDGTMTLDVIFKNSSDVVAKDIDVWVEICESCSFAKEPPGFDKPKGTIDLKRHMHLAQLNAGVYWQDTPIDIAVKQSFTFIEVGFEYSCETCGKGAIGKVAMQRIRALFPTP